MATGGMSCYLLFIAAGLAVGAFQVLWTAVLPKHPFPDKIEGVVKDLMDLLVKDLAPPIGILLVSGISMGFGASVGPEAAHWQASADWEVHREVSQSRIHVATSGNGSRPARFFTASRNLPYGRHISGPYVHSRNRKQLWSL